MKKLILIMSFALLSISNIVSAENNTDNLIKNTTEIEAIKPAQMIFLGKNKFGYEEYLKSQTKTYLELSKEYSNEFNKPIDKDWLKMDKVKAEIVKNVESEANKNNYEIYNEYFKKVLKKAQKTDVTFEKFYMEWINFVDKIDKVIGTGKIKNEKKLQILYTIRTLADSMVEDLCSIAKDGCGKDSNPNTKLKDIK